MRCLPLICVAMCCGALADARSFKKLSYAEVDARLTALAARYPAAVTLSTAEQRFGIAATHTCGTVPCRQHMVVIRAPWTPATAPVVRCRPSHPAGKRAAQYARFRTQVFISGAVHGDERVGPAVAVELAELLASQIELAVPDARNQSALWGTAEQRQQQPSFGRGLHTNSAWLRHLLDSREVIIMPAPNADGFYRARREEGTVDPNRDFPYLAPSPQGCMRTLTARAINEVWRAVPVTAAITFHGGMRALTWAWGAPNHESSGSETPDDAALRATATAMQQYAGPFGDGTLYPIGRTNRVVYPVTGGMSDWAYAAGWENNATVAPATPPVSTCEPTTHDAYPAARTATYPPGTGRAATFLVETADLKAPPDSAFGVLDASLLAGARGHVPQNIRLALALTDLAAPAVALASVTVCAAGEAACANTGSAGGQDACDADALVTVGWEVRGAVQVEATQVAAVWAAQLESGGSPPACQALPGAEAVCSTAAELHERARALAAAAADGTSPRPGVALQSVLWTASTDTAAGECAAQAIEPSLLSALHNGTADSNTTIAAGPVLRGPALWAAQRPQRDLAAVPVHTQFSSTLRLPRAALGPDPGATHDIPPPPPVLLVVWARVDTEFEQQPGAKPSPALPPQTHLAQRRRNSAWRFEVGGRSVHGQERWISQVLRVVACPGGPLTLARLDGVVASIGFAVGVDQCTHAPPSAPAGPPSARGNTPWLTVTIGSFILALALGAAGRGIHRNCSTRYKRLEGDQSGGKAELNGEVELPTTSRPAVAGAADATGAHHGTHSPDDGPPLLDS